jgi:hypothetical protein
MLESYNAAMWEHVGAGASPARRPERPPPHQHPLWRGAKHLAILYVVVYSLAFVCEGAMRLRYHIGSLAPIEKLATRGLRAKAEVARQKEIERMEADPLYLAYGGTMLLGAPIMFIVLLVADARLIWKLMNRVDARLRIIAIVCVGMFASGFMLMAGAYFAACRFYDRNSPAELLARLF